VTVLYVVYIVLYCIKLVRIQPQKGDLPHSESP